MPSRWTAHLGRSTVSDPFRYTLDLKKTINCHTLKIAIGQPRTTSDNLDIRPPLLCFVETRESEIEIGGQGSGHKRPFQKFLLASFSNLALLPTLKRDFIQTELIFI